MNSEKLIKLHDFLVNDGWAVLYTTKNDTIYSKEDSHELFVPTSTNHPIINDAYNLAIEELAELYNIEEDDILHRIYGKQEND